jgi:peptide deformylase
MSTLITAPNAVLSEVSRPYNFTKDDKFLSSFLKEMNTALLSASDPKGVGLAAPQIGKSLKIFITKPTDNSEISVFINPRIIEAKPENIEGKNTKKKKANQPKKLEGCLSLPNIWGEVRRSSSVTLEYQTQTGEKLTKKFTGFMAIIVQHEMDHLEGILFPRRVLEQKGKLYKSSKNEKNEDEFEELSI